MTTLANQFMNLERDVKALQSDYKEHKSDYQEHKKVFKERGKNHDANAKAMSDFSSTYNKLSDLISKLFDKVAYLEKKEQAHDTVVLGLARDISWIKGMMTAAVGMGMAFISFFVFFGGTLMNWW